MINESHIAAYLINMAYFLTTLLVLRIVTAYLNYSIGVRFGEVLREFIHKTPMGAAIYYSARWIGLCILAAAFLR